MEKRSRSGESSPDNTPANLKQHSYRVRALMHEINIEFQPILRDIVVKVLKRKLIAEDKNPEDFVKEAK